MQTNELLELLQSNKLNEFQDELLKKLCKARKINFDNLIEFKNWDKEFVYEFENGNNFVQEYLYKQILEDLEHANNKIDSFKFKYIFTHHNYLISKKEDGIQYGYLALGEIPILYFIYFDIHEFINKMTLIPKPKN